MHHKPYPRFLSPLDRTELILSVIFQLSLQHCYHNPLSEIAIFDMVTKCTDPDRFVAALHLVAKNYATRLQLYHRSRKTRRPLSEPALNDLRFVPSRVFLLRASY